MRLPSGAFKAAGRSKPGTLVALLLSGGLGGLYYWLRVHPDVVDAQRTLPQRPSPSNVLRAEAPSAEGWEAYAPQSAPLESETDEPIEPQALRLKWDYDAFPVWGIASGAMIRPARLPVSPELRSELQAWSDRVSDLMWSRASTDVSRDALSSQQVDLINVEAEALAARLRSELPDGFTVDVHRESTAP